MRVCASAETGILTDEQRSALFDTNWTVGRRADRMGVALEGRAIDIEHDGRMPSVPVFPGTTGGYPRIGQVARLDRHVMGQLRPGDHLRLLPREPGLAIAELEAKHDYWRSWLPEIREIV